MDDNKNFPIAQNEPQPGATPNPPPPKARARKKTLPRVFRYVLAVVAAILLITVGIFVWQFYSLSSNKIFKENYQPYVLSDIGPDSSNAEMLFHEKRFYELAKTKNTTGFTPKQQFLQSMAWLQLYNYDKAIAGLSQITSRNDTAGTRSMNDESEYYLALAYIANKDFDLALPLLNKIHDNPDHAYHDKISSKLIRQVKMLKWR